MEAATPAAAPPVPAPEAFARQQQIDRTKTGLLILFIGVLVSWVPYVSFAGIIVVLVGAILVILGRKAFGPAHSRNVLLALALFLGGIGGLVVVAVLLVNAILPVVPTTPAEVFALVTPYIPALLVTGGIYSLSYPLLAHAVSSRTGQILLWVGYAATLGILTTATYILLVGVFETAAAGISDPFGFFSENFTAFTTIILLFVVSYVLYAVGYYLAYSRVNRGEIPA
jgi:hypothetical protein